MERNWRSIGTDRLAEYSLASDGTDRPLEWERSVIILRKSGGALAGSAARLFNGEDDLIVWLSTRMHLDLKGGEF